MQQRFFDLHTDTASAIFDRGCHLAANDLHVDLERSAEGFFYLPFLTLFSDASHVAMEGRYEALRDNLRRETAGRCRTVKSREDYQAALVAGLRPVMAAVEGAEMLGASPERLRRAAREDGLTMSGIAWNNPNPLYTPDGLTEAGRDYIAACNESHVVVDLSHLNDACTAEALALSERAVASHSDARALCPVPRNLPDALIRRIGDRGGLIGLNFCAWFVAEKPEEQTLERLAEHAAHIALLAGVGVLALGSDFDGAPLPRGVSGVEHLPLFAAALEKAGFAPGEVDDICFGNAWRFFFEETHAAPDAVSR